MISLSQIIHIKMRLTTSQTISHSFKQFRLAYFCCSRQQSFHPYVEEALSRRNYLPLKAIQTETFQAFSNDKNAFLNSCTGSGKTLAYLVPIMNRIVEDQENGINRQNQRHGAVILTLNKQLCTQVYRELRLLDFQNRLNIVRTGSISHISPVIDDMSKPNLTAQQQSQIEEKIEMNVSSSVNWGKIDVLISTPQLLSNILSYTRTTSLSPKILVIDQADLLLEIDRNVVFYTNKVLDHMKSKNDMKFILTASSFPPKMSLKNKRLPSEQLLGSRFPPLEFIPGEDKHRLPEKTDLLYVSMVEHTGKSKNDFLKPILEERLPRKMIIFCHNKETVREVAEWVRKEITGSNPVEYYAGLSSNERGQALFAFENEDRNILVSTQLGSRGLNFQIPIHSVIEYDMSENIVNFVNRAGRTGRNSLPGEMITFVEEKNQQFFKHLHELQQNSGQFDQLFSRKRSYRKLFLKQHTKQAKDT